MLEVYLSLSNISLVGLLTKEYYIAYVSSLKWEQRDSIKLSLS